MDKFKPGYDYSKLSKRQLEVFEQIAVNNDARHPPQTLDSLVRAGLIELYHQQPVFRGDGLVKINRYRVSVAVHRDWCAWCDSQPEATSND